MSSSSGSLSREAWKKLSTRCLISRFQARQSLIVQFFHHIIGQIAADQRPADIADGLDDVDVVELGVELGRQVDRMAKNGLGVGAHAAGIQDGIDAW